MKKINYIIIIILLFVTSIWAQRKQGNAYAPSLDFVDMKQIDVAYLRVFYAFNAEKLDDESTYIDKQCLEIGNDFCKYYSHFLFLDDSVRTEWKKSHKHSAIMPHIYGNNGWRKSKWIEYQYSEYFIHKGYLTEYARMPLHMNYQDCQYTEKYPLQNWILENETKIICGYMCQKATCHFRGRDFEAWFALDIPLKSGPYKFGGLPGLILRIYDTNHLYTFDCIGIHWGEFPIMKKKTSSYQELKRVNVLKLQRAANENYFQTSGAKDWSGNPKSHYVSYEPLELE